MNNIVNNKVFQEGAFLLGFLLLLGAWKFGIEGLME